MFRNRISVVRRAKTASKPTSIQLSLCSTNEGDAKGDGPSSSSSSSLPVKLMEHPCGFNRASEVVTPSSSTAAAGSSVMEISKPDEGICIDETAFSWVDSGEIEENELRVTVDDNNDVTKDLDLSRPSPSLFSVTTPKRARMLLEMQKRSAERNGSMVAVPVSSSTPLSSTAPLSVSFRTTQTEVSPAMFRCNVDETPNVQQQQQQQYHQQAQSIPWNNRSLDSQLMQTEDLKRQSIAGAIDDLNEMTDELIDFIKGFEKKYSKASN